MSCYEQFGWISFRRPGGERFHRILLEEWAYIRPWDSETERTQAYTGFIHFYNHHRAHGALGWATPTSIIQDNLLEEHT